MDLNDAAHSQLLANHVAVPFHRPPLDRYETWDFVFTGNPKTFTSRIFGDKSSHEFHFMFPDQDGGIRELRTSDLNFNEYKQMFASLDAEQKWALWTWGTPCYAIPGSENSRNFCNFNLNKKLFRGDTLTPVEQNFLKSLMGALNSMPSLTGEVLTFINYAQDHPFSTPWGSNVSTRRTHLSCHRIASDSVRLFLADTIRWQQSKQIPFRSVATIRAPTRRR